MTREKDQFSDLKIGRRRFLGGAVALGALPGLTSGLLMPRDARAQETKRGGHLKLGLKGGATSDALDPATYSASVLFVIGRLWGDTLVESDPKTGAPLPSLATSWTPSADIRLDFQDPGRRAVSRRQQDDRRRHRRDAEAARG